VFEWIFIFLCLSATLDTFLHIDPYWRTAHVDHEACTLVACDTYSVTMGWIFGSGTRFSKAPETFRARKAIAKSRTLRLQNCFIHIFLLWREVPFVQEVSGVYTSPFLDTDGLKMAFRARKVSGAFEKRAPGVGGSSGKVSHEFLDSLWENNRTNNRNLAPKQQQLFHCDK